MFEGSYFLSLASMVEIVEGLIGSGLLCGRCQNKILKNNIKLPFDNTYHIKQYSLRECWAQITSLQNS